MKRSRFDTPSTRHARRWGAGLLIAVGLATGCAVEGDAAGDGLLRVVATTGMIADAATRIGGGRVSVQGLMGPGIDPHLYKASAGDVRRLAAADLILYNGLHLEAAMSDVLQEMSGRRRTVAVSDGVDRSRLTAPPEFQGNYDPHIWFDVRMWMQAVHRIEAALTEADPDGAEHYARATASYLGELEELDAWVRERVAELPRDRRVLVTAHDAFGYFGRAYGFDVLGLQGISTTAEAGTADVQRLAEEIARRRTPAIFIETSIPPRTIEAVQAAVRSRGHRVAIGGSLFSDALGDSGTPEGSYLGMVRHNVNTIVDALSVGLVAE